MPEMVAGLLGVGMTELEIAKECGCGQSTVSRIANDVVDPRISVCKKIAELYCNKVGYSNAPQLILLGMRVSEKFESKSC
jgi:transcriptional regulator with XRE-family HTH domain